jgi:hypothetical protein
MLGISWVAAQLTASQEGLSCMSEWLKVVTRGVDLITRLFLVAKSEEKLAFAPPYISMALCLINKSQGQLYIYIIM